MIDPALVAGAMGFILGAASASIAFLAWMLPNYRLRIDRPRDARGRFVARRVSDRMSVGAE